MAHNFSEEEYKKIRKRLLKKLYSDKCWSKGHMLFERLMSGLPGHLKGTVVDILDDLLKEGLVLFYGRTKYGNAYQLNIKKIKEIEEIIKSG